MNDQQYERFISEWMAEEPDAPAPWILSDVVEHARRHPHRSWKSRLAAWLAVPGSTVPHRRLVFAVAVMVVVAFAVVPFVWRGPAQPPDEAPAFLPPSPSPQVDENRSFAAEGGLIGSVWLEAPRDSDAAVLYDNYITLHPDGTVVHVGAGPATPVGLGVWKPTGSFSLTSAIVYPDADPLFHLASGVTIYRAAWTFDEDAGTWGRTWTATIEPADGSSASEATGSSTLTRLLRLPLPADASYPAPPEPAWGFNSGPMMHGATPGRVLEIPLSWWDHEAIAGDPPDYLVTHGDGTAFMVSRVTGAGSGLWSEAGPEAMALTAWSDEREAPEYGAWVGQLIGADNVRFEVGDQEGFYNRRDAVLAQIEPMMEQIPPVDPELWPARGAVWLEPTDAGPIVSAYLTDGTVIIRHPDLGTGVGYWQPTGEDTIVASAGFSTLRQQDHRRWLEGTIAPDGESMSITYRLQDVSGGPVETGEASATRLSIEP